MFKGIFGAVRIERHAFFVTWSKHREKLLGIIMLAASYFIPDTPNNLLQMGRYTEAIESIK